MCRFRFPICLTRKNCTVILLITIPVSCCITLVFATLKMNLSWRNKVKGFLLDISGVLYDSGPGGGTAIPGSVDAVKRLKDSGFSVRFCTNETQNTRNKLGAKLRGFGFLIEDHEIFPPAPALCSILRQRSLRPFLLVHPNLLPEFEDIPQQNPNCVVVGDAADAFNYKNLNDAFRILISDKDVPLFSLGKGKYYKQTEGLMLDVGPFTSGLEYACDITAEVVGKPSTVFYSSVVSDMKLKPEQCVMIGDDVMSDVGGAQNTGMKGILVRTGKFRPEDERNERVTPDLIADNLEHAVSCVLQQQ